MQVGETSFTRPLGRAGPLQPVTPVSPAGSGSSWSLEDQAFGAALVREARRQEPQTGLYGPDARLRGASSSAQSEEESAEARTVAALEQRDREVRQNEEKRGGAVGGSSYIYQTGPDGEQYAVGTTAHVVRQEQSGAAAQSSSPKGSGAELSDSEQDLLRRLRDRDAKVRGHETAHIMAASGQVVGGATYQYQTGPDGRQYAVGGSVNISMGSSFGDDEETARRAATAQRAAMAAGDPSLRDMQAAMRASNLASRARQRGMNAYAGQAYGEESSEQAF